MKLINHKIGKMLSIFVALAMTLSTFTAFGTVSSFAAEEGQSISVTASGSWNDSAKELTGVKVKVQSPVKNLNYMLQKGSGSSWIGVGSRIKAEDRKIRNNPDYVSWSFDISKSTAVDACLRVIGAKETNILDKCVSGKPLNKDELKKLWQSEEMTVGSLIAGILDNEKSGFSDWLENSYVEDFGGVVPKTCGDVYEAFAVYKSIPSVTVEKTVKNGEYYLEASVSDKGSYDFSWQYCDENGKWKTLTDSKASSINASECEALLDGGAKVRAKIETKEGVKIASNVIFINPLKDKYDNAIKSINEGLNLSKSTVYWRQRNNTPTAMTVDLSIGGERFNKYFYYDNIALDLPVTDAESYANYLAKVYLDNGAGEAGLAAVKKVWDRYLYDIYDPSYDAGKLKNLDSSVYPGSTYGDKANNIKWPKDEASSFNTSPSLTPGIDNLDYSYLERGVDYSSAINRENGIKKKVTADGAGDANSERSYNIDLETKVDSSMKAPVAMILQVQSSWQMFDLDHANCVKGDGTYATIEVGGAAYNTELANLYAIKKALIRFADYMEDNYKGNNLVLGVTETQHGKSSSLFYQGTGGKAGGKEAGGKPGGKEAGGKPGGKEAGDTQAMYVTNDHDTIIEGLQSWNSFGNCEHVHYDSESLEAAVKALKSNLSGWTDSEEYPLDYKDIRKVAVIVGGSTENTTGTNGYGITLPWSTFQTAELNSVYAIRANEGTPVAENAQKCISWLEYSGNFGAGKTPFADGKGTTYTDEYVATSADAVFDALVAIADREMANNGVSKTDSNIFVEDVTVTDEIQDEFKLDEAKGITAVITDRDGKVVSEKKVELDDKNLQIEEKSDGTTTITYNFGKVYSATAAKLSFGIKAKEDYIGGNNVLSNVGTPELTYKHTVLDKDGNPTSKVNTYEVACQDTPEVNVPIDFEVGEGSEIKVAVGEEVDLASLDSEKIVEKAHQKIQLYDQINGTLSYKWELPDGTMVDVPTAVHITKGTPDEALPDQSALTQCFTPEEVGQYSAKLHVTFTPDAAADNGNFADSATAEPVNSMTGAGNVKVIADNPLTSYVVRYVDRATKTDIADPKNVDNQKVGDTVTEEAVDSDTYDLDDDSVKTLTLQSGENEIIFYYKPAVAHYTVRYVYTSEEGEYVDIIAPENGTGNVGSTISKSRKSFAEYELISSERVIRKTLTRNDEDNVIIFRYRKIY